MNAITTRNLTIAFFVLLAFGAASPLLFGQAKFPPWLEVVLGGLMSGVLYSLVAIGLVLIFKASGVFNFAQGAMVLFAALAMARFMEWIPKWLGFDNKMLAIALAFIAAMAVMIALAWLIERLVLGKLVNQDGITLLMATLGISYFLDGFGQTLFGSDIYKIDIGMPKDLSLIHI